MKVNILRSISFIFALSLSSTSVAAENTSAPKTNAVSQTSSTFRFGISAGLGHYQNPINYKDDLKIPVYPKIFWTNNKNFYFDNFEMGYLLASFDNSIIEAVGKFNIDGLYHLDSSKGFIPPLVISPHPNEPEFIAPEEPNLSYMGGIRYTQLLNNDKELITAGIYTDVSGQHNGQQFEFSWTHKWIDRRFKLASEIMLRYKSYDLLNYYYGDPLQGDQVSSQFRIDMGYQLDANWLLVANFSREYLSDAIRSSEIVDDDYLDTYFVGVTWKW
ncbi:MipA/OmpV family protein [Thalassotalea sp. PLHSN55]|uniref:MipA/OmpV family protein n=1 Tax=Thalassotalea sp. PLHSN55 TaxID=3435888 RepID=UPI003F8588AB